MTPASSSRLIEMQGVGKVYRSESIEYWALQEVDLTVERGEYAAIMGPSGSGKSTLLQIIGLLDVPDAGIYRLDGSEVQSLVDDQRAALRNRKIGFIFQSFFLLPRYTALRNVSLPLIYRGTSPAERETLAQAALRQVGLGDRMQHLPRQLSGGQQQRVAIARALVQDPELLLADEPTGNLDSRASAEIMEILDHLNREGRTVIVVTHDPEVAKHTRRVIRVHGGRIVN